MPWTLAFILNTWSDRDCCKSRNAASSRERGVDEDELPVLSRPVSMSWKLMLAAGGGNQGYCALAE